MAQEQCKVPGCGNPADFEVILYDVYLNEQDIFFEQDYTCPFICGAHMEENERNIRGKREPRGYNSYPYTNKEGGQGFTIYRPLE